MLDEIVSIEYVGEEETIDINTTGNRLFYANDILTHNSAVDEQEFNHSHISGGISKINSADNVIGIMASNAMKEQGRYQLQLMKTRSSSGVGKKIDLNFDVNTLRITDPGLAAQGTYQNAPSQATTIMNGLKPTSSVQPSPKVNAQVDSSKLKALLGNMKNK